MKFRNPLLKCLSHAGIFLFCAIQAFSQSVQTPTHADLLRGSYGPFRANNDLLSYALDVRVDPDKQLITGKNTIRFKMLKDDTRIQIDLYPNMKVEEIVFGPTELKYTRDEGAVFIDFPASLKKGRTYSIDFYYSGKPVITNFGGLFFKKNKAGDPWIASSCEINGASLWWPNKDQWRDEVENMTISVAVPTGLTDVSNGQFVGSKDLGDGYTRWDWKIDYPINSYGASINIGKYEHWSEKLGDLPLDFYAVPENLDRAKKQFEQARGMLEAYQHYFGEYPFKKDGYKLIQTPYVGMEHQSAIAYGNRFLNGFIGKDYTGAGISMRFDYIIIHESAHEWFGNAVSASDISDMWIHEGWATYLECLYVEYTYGHDDYLKYVNSYKKLVENKTPIITPRGTSTEPSLDQYSKGGLLIHTLRSIVNDDTKWWRLIHDFYQHFKYRNIMTEDAVAWFDQTTRMNLTPVFNQYLRHAAIPKLEVRSTANGHLAYRWIADESGFTMPVKIGTKDHWQIITPTTNWQTTKIEIKMENLEAATDLYYIDFEKIT
ncbi:MAG: M1 family metallopeptidase [Acidobacteriota bacterium]